MADNGRLAGKRALVSGSGTGIGRGIAEEFARQGAAVALHYSHSDKGAREAVDAIRQAGGKAEAFKADFNDLQAVQKLAPQASEFLGGLDILVNNAGITLSLPFEEVKPEQFDTLFNVNIKAMYFLTQSAAAIMAPAGGGAVVNLTSVHAFHAMTEHSVYASTKGAIVAFTRTVAIELALKNIRVNAIAPGWIAVEYQFKVIKDLDIKKAGHNIPAGFVGEPVDVAKFAVFLASDEARYIFAQTFTIDGGQMSIMANTGDFHESRSARFGQGYVPGV